MGAIDFESPMMYDDYIMGLTRTQISLSDEDRRVLDVVSRRTGQSMSALIRSAIHEAYGYASDQDRVQAALDASFGVVGAEAEGREVVDVLRARDRLAELA